MRLHRSMADAMSAGVCSGIAAQLDWSPTRVRLVVLILSLLTGLLPGVFLYLILWFLMPPDDTAPRTVGEHRIT